MSTDQYERWEAESKSSQGERERSSCQTDRLDRERTQRTSVSLPAPYKQ